jgi:hypothetical protein
MELESQRDAVHGRLPLTGFERAERALRPNYRRLRAGLPSDCGSRGFFSEHPGESERALQPPPRVASGSTTGRS